MTKVEVGLRFGRLTVVRRDGTMGKSAMWQCECDCGNQKRVSGANLVSGDVQSCGCLAASGENRFRKHGMSRTRVYSIWRAMKNRCYLKSDPSYHAYGGRGITVCDRWRDSFENFYADMGDPPSEAHTIDRRENDGNYERDNCRWATNVEQANNRSSNLVLEISGEKATLAEWSRRSGIPSTTIRERLMRGWTPERLLTPSRAYKKKEILQEEYNARTP